MSKKADKKLDKKLDKVKFDKIVEHIYQGSVGAECCIGKKVTAVFGETQVGKSTVINAWKGIPFVLKDGKVVTADGRKPPAPIGANGVSCTMHPVVYPTDDEDFVFFDTVGWKGNEDKEITLASKILLDMGLSSATEIRFVFLSSCVDFARGASKMLEFVKNFSELISKPVPVFWLFNRYHSDDEDKQFDYMTYIKRARDGDALCFKEAERIVEDDLRKTYTEKVREGFDVHLNGVESDLKTKLCALAGKEKYDDSVLEKLMANEETRLQVEQITRELHVEEEAMFMQLLATSFDMKNNWFCFVEPTVPLSVEYIKDKIRSMPFVDKDHMKIGMRSDVSKNMTEFWRQFGDYVTGQFPTLRNWLFAKRYPEASLVEAKRRLEIKLAEFEEDRKKIRHPEFLGSLEHKYQGLENEEERALKKIVKNSEDECLRLGKEVEEFEAAGYREIDREEWDHMAHPFNKRVIVKRKYRYPFTFEEHLDPDAPVLNPDEHPEVKEGWFGKWVFEHDYWYVSRGKQAAQMVGTRLATEAIGLGIAIACPASIPALVAIYGVGFVGQVVGNIIGAKIQEVPAKGHVVFLALPKDIQPEKYKQLKEARDRAIADLEKNKHDLQILQSRSKRDLFATIDGLISKTRKEIQTLETVIIPTVRRTMAELEKVTTIRMGQKYGTKDDEIEKLPTSELFVHYRDVARRFVCIECVKESLRDYATFMDRIQDAVPIPVDEMENISAAFNAIQRETR